MGIIWIQYTGLETNGRRSAGGYGFMRPVRSLVQDALCTDNLWFKYMDQELYDLVFSGQLVAGQDVNQVKRNIQLLFRIDGDKVDVLFSGKAITLKKALGADAANKYRVAMKKAGALVNLIPVAGSIASTGVVGERDLQASQKSLIPASYSTALGATPSAPPQPRPQIDAPDFSVAAVGSNLVSDSEKRQVKPVEVDISGLSIAAPGGHLVDKDELPVASSAAVNVPDLSVAPVGADVLKPEERTRVAAAQIDISQLSASVPGERLSPEAKAAPPAPNVDHIKLVD